MTTPRPRRFQPLTTTEARQFLQAAANDRLHALYELALRTGLRKGELPGLHWEDLDLDGGTATIHRSLQRSRTQGLTVLHTKTLTSERRIALPTDCISSLKIHQERQQEERQAAGTSWTDNGLVFTTPTDRPLDPTNLTRRLRRLLHGAQLRTIRFHDLPTLDGHSAPHIGVTAGVYAHVRLRLQRQAIAILGDALSPTDDDLTTHPPQLSSADVAVSVAVKQPSSPRREFGGGLLVPLLNALGPWWPISLRAVPHAPGSQEIRSPQIALDHPHGPRNQPG